MKGLIRIVSISTMLVSFNINAGVIDFELNASGALPSDNEVLGVADVFTIDDVDLIFGFDTNADGVIDQPAVFEEVGNVDAGNDTGFWGIGGARDIAAPGFESVLGSFFLRQFEPYTPFGAFTILYDALAPVTAASGEIWDIDGKIGATERFTVEAFNGSTLLQTLQSPEGVDFSLNGQPWTFGFTGLSDITKIEITFSGSKTSGIGLAFNNFSPVTSLAEPTSVSEPSLFALVLVSATLMILSTRNYKR